MSGIWISLPELAEAIGPEAARILSQERGGIDFYVPRLTPPGHALCRIIGFAAATRLCAMFGGGYITVPNGNRPEPRKGEVLALLAKRAPVQKIALQLGLTERYVKFVAAQARRTVQQLPLPL